MALLEADDLWYQFYSRFNLHSRFSSKLTSRKRMKKSSGCVNTVLLLVSSVVHRVHMELALGRLA